MNLGGFNAASFVILQIRNDPPGRHLRSFFDFFRKVRVTWQIQNPVMRLRGNWIFPVFGIHQSHHTFLGGACQCNSVCLGHAFGGIFLGMTSFGKFTLRFAAYGVIAAYLACDLFLFHGPLYKRLQAKRPDSADAIADAGRRGIAAVVYGREITLAQVDHAVRARIVREGGTPIESLPPDQIRLRRYAALGDLIDHELLRVKAMHSTSELVVEDADIDAAFARVAARYADENSFRKALAAAGEDEEMLRARLAARIQQTKYTDSKLDPLASPGDAAARHRSAREFREELRRFEENRDRIHIRHEVLRRDPAVPEG